MDKPLRRLDFGRPGALFARMVLRVTGWRLEDDRKAPVRKCVFACAPHTSNWDLILMMLTAMALRIPVYFLMKDSVFVWPANFLWRWLGAVPVDRSKSHNLVDQVVQAFRETDEMYLVLTPEGTRKQIKYWKTGFYWMAHAADVPIVMAWNEYSEKRVGVGGLVHPSGDLEADFPKIRAIFEEKIGLSPQLRPAEDGRETRESA